MLITMILRVLQAVALLLGLVVARGVWYLLQCFQAQLAYARSKVPGPPLVRSPLGHVTCFCDYAGPWRLAKLAEEYGPIFKLQLLRHVRYYITDPTTIQQICKKSGPGTYLPKPREIYWPMENMTKPHLMNILTATDGPYWKAVRQGTAPCFSINNMKKVFPVVLELTQRAADKMSQSVAAGGGSPVSFDISDAAKRITSDVMGQLLFGEDLEGTKWKESEYLQIFSKVLAAMDSQFTVPLYFWQRLWNKQIADQYTAMQRHDEIMTQKIQKLLEHPPPDYTIAAHLMTVKDPATGKALTLGQLKAEASIFMGAGFETTSHAISWTLAFLATHQGCQQAAYNELQSLGLTTRDVTTNDLSNMPYISAVIKESLRLCPPNPWGTNKVTTEKETEILGFKLPKGSYIETPLLPLAILERNYGKTALLFKPERWLERPSAESRDSAAAAADAPAGDEPLTSSNYISKGSVAAAAADAAAGDKPVTSSHDIINGSAAAAAGAPAEDKPLTSSNDVSKGSAAAAAADAPAGDKPLTSSHDIIEGLVAAAAAADAPAGDKPLTSSNDIINSGLAAPKAVDISDLAAPDPLTFMVGPRDCIGQSLARMELQVVLAVLLSRFKFYPGPKLRKEVKTAASLGQTVVSAIHACARVHVTMQPAGSQMLLDTEARS